MARAGIGFLAGVVIHRASLRGLLAKLPAIDPRLVFGMSHFALFHPALVLTPVFAGRNPVFILMPAALLLA